MPRSSEMPAVTSLEDVYRDLTPDEIEIVKLILDGNHVRATKPNHKKSRQHGIAAYIWRDVVFLVSPVSQHQCMPMTSWLYLPEDLCKLSYSLRDEAKRAEWKTVWEPKFKKINDAITNNIPKDQWHGVRRWSSVLGNMSHR